MIRIAQLVIVLALTLTTTFYSLAQRSDFQQIDFSRADNMALRFPNHSLKNIKVLADKLTQGLTTDVEKFRALYRWVCDNIAYDYALFEKNRRLRAKQENTADDIARNKKFNAEVFRTLLEKHRTVCTGYAYLLRELCSHVGISCVIVDGYGRTANANIGGNGIPNHSWNAVQLHGKWYLSDPTWASGAVESQFHLFIKNYDDAYFLSDPNVFIQNHYPLDPQWTLLKTNTVTLNEFLNRPIIYSNAYHYQVDNPSPTRFNVAVRKGEEISFQFDSRHDFSQAALMVDGKSIQHSFDKKGLRYSTVQAFNNKGVHVVHLMIDNKSVLTYRVSVK
ncbi:transglutaminase domain-containing protein [Pseudochryseolinea flava]|uniref:Transglutaminase-like domain-containing protein n=1 Tax=Pseudochryseolinea flava TaxID=2059302 RepID=A0A364Y3P6_9BACT|nr:transglutaminase domain-containing protein [Pseudochryseolinea flava]RAW00639.1 hypothetical protein DQQ10_13695 [Pseudochryseolinea flava]